jgi:hypothetical protein
VKRTKQSLLMLGLVLMVASIHAAPRPAPVPIKTSASLAILYSPVDLAASGLGSPGAGVANEVHGTRFALASTKTSTGARFYWSGTTTRTIRCKLWNFDTSTQLATVDVSITGAGSKTCNWGSAQTLSAFVRYTLSYWEISGTESNKFTPSTPYLPAFPLISMTTGVIWEGWNFYAVGDIQPTNIAGSERYMIEPIITVTTNAFAQTSTANTYTAAQNVSSVALTDASSIVTDASSSNIFTVTLGGNRTLANPTNLISGGIYLWVITQDGTGSRTLSYGTAFKWPGGTAPTLTTTAGAVDTISCVYTSTTLKCVPHLNFS